MELIQFNSILIYLHANLTAQGQLQSKHERRGKENKNTYIQKRQNNISFRQ
jgi:hypothetical protein